MIICFHATDQFTYQTNMLKKLIVLSTLYHYNSTEFDTYNNYTHLLTHALKVYGTHNSSLNIPMTAIWNHIKIKYHQRRKQYIITLE